MANSEDWRRQRAEELAARRQPGMAAPFPPANRPVPPPFPPPFPPVAAAPARAAPARADVRLWQGIALALALLLAVALGWVVRDVTSSSAPDPEPALAAPLPIPQSGPAPTVPLPSEAPPPARTPDVLPSPPIAAATTLPQRVVTPRPARPTTVNPPTLRRPARTAARPAAACRRSGTVVYRLICTEPALAARDARLTRLYRRAMARADRDLGRRIDQDQSDFLNRRSRCQDARCIARLTDRRIDRLARYVGG